MESLLRFGLFGVFGALVLAALGLPVPEEVSLVTAGVLARTGYAPLPLSFVVGYIGVLCGDCIAWSMGRLTGGSPTGPVGRLIGPAQLQRVRRFYRRYGLRSIIIARQLPGMRTPTFFFAGASGVPLGRFLLIDGAAAILTAGLYVSLGFLFAEEFSAMLSTLDTLRNTSGVLAGLVMALFIGWVVYRRLRRDGPPEPLPEES